MLFQVEMLVKVPALFGIGMDGGANRPGILAPSSANTTVAAGVLLGRTGCSSAWASTARATQSRKGLAATAGHVGVSS